MTNPNATVDTYQQQEYSEIREGGSYMATYKGLTKREYFAAMALQGSLSNPEGMTYLSFKFDKDIDGAIERLAEKSIRVADALINQLNKTPYNETP